GEDEDEDGAVRSEGSGPQSWAIVPTVTAASGDLRRTSWRQDHRPTKRPRQQEPTNAGDKNYAATKEFDQQTTIKSSQTDAD
ncbi:hypothetical protein, partial [Achromobacter sp.]|uniref:hypothetical protein n=1 Tax=Achromobacter sp. TaxID=134375 RepID=UPI0031D87425